MIGSSSISTWQRQNNESGKECFASSYACTARKEHGSWYCLFLSAVDYERKQPSAIRHALAFIRTFCSFKPAFLWQPVCWLTWKLWTFSDSGCLSFERFDESTTAVLQPGGFPPELKKSSLWVTVTSPNPIKIVPAKPCRQNYFCARLHSFSPSHHPASCSPKAFVSKSNQKWQRMQWDARKLWNFPSPLGPTSNSLRNKLKPTSRRGKHPSTWEPLCQFTLVTVMSFGVAWRKWP